MLPHRSAALLAALVLTSSFVLSACGGEDKDSPQPKPAQTSITGPGTTPSANFAAGEEFFRAIATGTEEALTEAAEQAAPDSSAAAYVAELQQKLEGGAKVRTRQLTIPSTGLYELCSADGKKCGRITQVALVDGKVSSFALNGKQVGIDKN